MPRLDDATELCARGWRRLRRAVAGFERNQHFITAGHLAFVGFFALFPFLIVLVYVAAAIGSTEAAREALDAALAQMPAEVADALGPVAEQLVTTPRGGTLTFGLITALWAASSSFEALRYAFNRAYEVREPRQAWWRRAQSLALTLLFALGIVLATLSVVVVPIAVDLAAALLDLPSLRERGTTVISRSLGLSLLVAATAAIYKVLPRVPIAWSAALPGAVLCVAGFFALASAFGFYLTEIATLSLTYGSLGGVVATLVFFYLTGCVVLFGCEFNAAGDHAAGDHAGSHERP